MSQSEKKINFLSYKNLNISNKKNHLNVWLEDGSLISVAMKDIVDTFLKEKSANMKQVEGHNTENESTKEIEVPF